MHSLVCAPFCTRPQFRLIFILMALLLVALLPLPWPTLSGSGLTKSVNIITWMWVCLCTLTLSFTVWRKRLQGRRVLWPLLLGGVLMAVPLLWTPEVFRANAIGRLIGIAGSIFFFALLIQLPVRGLWRRRIYGVLVVAGLVQLALACWQVWFPDSAATWLAYDFNAADGRPLGSLAQVNVLSSFLVTALACAVWLALSALRVAGIKRLSPWLNGLCIVLLSAGVMMTQSRSMQAAAVITLIVLLSLSFDSSSWRKVVSLLVVGVMLGGLVFPLMRATQLAPDVTSSDARPSDVQARLAWNRQHSNNERYTLFNASLLLPREHVLAGEGLGSFEVRFPQVLLVNGVANAFPNTVIHPHNELLYVWFEGGVVAITGMLLWLIVWLSPSRMLVASLLRLPTNGWRYASLKGRNTAARWALTLPVMIHVMSEFPLYQSAAHLVVLLALFWLALPMAQARIKPLAARHRRSPMANSALTAAVVVLSLTGLLFLSSGLHTVWQLRDAESFDLMEPDALTTVANPYAQADRLLFDRAVGDLMAFNLTRDKALLEDFQQKAMTWLGRHNDASLTFSMLQIARAHNNVTGIHMWQTRGCMSFSQDARFQCQSLSPQP